MTTIDTPVALEQKIKTVCDVLRRSNCAGALQYVPELSWLLFLRFLDDRENAEERAAHAQGTPFRPSVSDKYRWRSWAAPDGEQRRTLREGVRGDTFTFLSKDLLPHLKEIGKQPGATARQQLISQIVEGVDQTRVDTEHNFLDVLDLVDEIRLDGVDDQHMFPLSEAYEGLLLSMGEKNNDGGQFYTPREVVRAMVKVVDPQVGDIVYDPCCGTGGFLAQAHEYMRDQLGPEPPATDIQLLAEQTFYGREKDNLAYPIALANLVLHGIDFPHIWHGNTLTENADYADLFAGAPSAFQVVLTNPPFGGKEGIEAKGRFDYKTSSTQVLFLQEVINSLPNGGRAGMVIDEGLLFRTNENAFVQTKQKLLDECDLYCIVSLAPGVFTSAGSGVKTNLLFFNKGPATERIWYYEIIPKGRERFNKSDPLTLAHFDEFFELLPTRAESENSWSVSLQQIKANNYDLKAVNPNRPSDTDTRTPAELLDEIETHGRELADALADLRQALRLEE